MNLIQSAIRHGYTCVLALSQMLLGKDRTKQLDARIRFGRKLNLKNPRTLSDKVCYISLHKLPQLAAMCTDKWEVRKYISQKGLADILIPTYGSAVSKFEDIDFCAFPDRFVLKATHGCGMNYVCMDRRKLDIEACKKAVRQWLRTTYGTFSMEPHYRRIPHRVYCEMCLGTPEQMVDYKIHCLNGKPSFILVCSARDHDNPSTRVKMDIFDTEWNWVDVIQPFRGHVSGSGDIKRPTALDRMLEIAKILSADFDFVRVDLYEIEGTVYFGELTFTPANGIFPSYRQNFLQAEGEKLTISER